MDRETLQIITDLTRDILADPNYDPAYAAPDLFGGLLRAYVGSTPTSVIFADDGKVPEPSAVDLSPESP